MTLYRNQITDRKKIKHKWESMYEELKRYYNEYGYDNSSIRSFSPVLEKWVQIQRRKSRKNMLRKEQINKLEELKGWEWN